MNKNLIISKIQRYFHGTLTFDISSIHETEVLVGGLLLKGSNSTIFMTTIPIASPFRHLHIRKGGICDTAYATNLF